MVFPKINHGFLSADQQLIKRRLIKVEAVSCLLSAGRMLDLLHVSLFASLPVPARFKTHNRRIVADLCQMFSLQLHRTGASAVNHVPSLASVASFSRRVSELSSLFPVHLPEDPASQIKHLLCLFQTGGSGPDGSARSSRATGPSWAQGASGGHRKRWTQRRPWPAGEFMTKIVKIGMFFHVGVISIEGN